VRKVGYTIAVVLIALSCISFVARGLNLGAEFTGGRAYVIRFDKAVSAEEVRQNLGEAFSQHAGADASAISFEVKQYGNENQMRIGDVPLRRHVGRGYRRSGADHLRRPEAALFVRHLLRAVP